MTALDMDEGDVEAPEEEAPPAPAVLLLGTAHVVPLRQAIQHHIFQFQPGAVALELDPGRLEGLLADPEDRERGGIIYGLIARFQERVAEDMGGSVGDEMLAGREAGLLLGVPVALIDLPAEVTFRRLLRRMGWGERLRVIGSVLASLLPGKQVEDELQRALEGDPRLIEEVAEKFPTVKEVLIDERDRVMADRCVRLAQDHGSVAAVVGDAHVPGMAERIRQSIADVREVRVRDLREGVPGQAGFSVKADDGGSDEPERSPT